MLIVNPRHCPSPTAFIMICMFAVLVFACNNTTPATQQKISDISSGKNVTSAQRQAQRPKVDSSHTYSNLTLNEQGVHKFIAQQHILTATAERLLAFYEYRSYQYAWFNDSGFTEQALAFRSLYDYDKDSADKRTTLDNRLDELVNKDSLKPGSNDPQIISTEMMMTWRLLNYLTDKLQRQSGGVETLNGFVPYTKRTTNEWVTFMGGTPPSIDAGNKWLGRMQKALQQLVAIRQKGGWDTIVIPRTVPSFEKPSPFFSVLKKRLFITGELHQQDTSSAVTPALVAAIKAAQSQFGFSHDTVVTRRLLKELNCPVEVRIRQLIVNMARMQWMPAVPSGDYIMVNIPEYRLYVMNSNTLRFGMDVITGKEGHATVMFSGKLNEVVFSPFWNLPASIAKKEVIPKLRKNKKYLAKNKMEIKGHRGGLPVIRQLPGEKNELGKIKFLFPNSQHIYFHDTPHKWLFSRDLRAYSHGCIRLSEPQKLAAFVLQGTAAWTPEKIDSAMNSGREKYVAVPKPIPVLIYYFTAWVDDAGIIQYRNDIYKHDAAFAQRLFVQ